MQKEPPKTHFPVLWVEFFSRPRGAWDYPSGTRELLGFRIELAAVLGYAFHTSDEM
jgi:hypothetical protein